MGSKVEQVWEQMTGNKEQPLFVGSYPEEFEDAILGVAHRFGADPVIAYDYDEVISILEKQFDELTDYDDDYTAYETAVEWFEFNVIGAYMGESTPIYIERVQ